MRLHLDENIEENIIQKIHTAYEDYTIHKKPLEYILWHVDFFNVPFYVNEHTLIPRPETEYMITAVSEYVASLWKEFNNILLDIGTGCGVLGISVLLQNPDFYRHIFFSDISSEALIVAKKNYDTLITSNWYDTRFIQSDLVAFIEHYLEIIKSWPITLVANLPYIPDETFDNNALENVQKREPRLAFVGGDDGLDLYRKMFEQIKSALSWVTNLVMFLEMMTRQVDILREEFGDRLEFEEVKTFHFNIKIVKAWIK